MDKKEIKRNFIKYKLSKLITEAEEISTLLESGYDQDVVEDEECREFAEIREEIKKFIEVF